MKRYMAAVDQTDSFSELGLAMTLLWILKIAVT